MWLNVDSFTFGQQAGDETVRGCAAEMERRCKRYVGVMILSLYHKLWVEVIITCFVSTSDVDEMIFPNVNLDPFVLSEFL